MVNRLKYAIAAAVCVTCVTDTYGVKFCAPVLNNYGIFDTDYAESKVNEKSELEDLESLEEYFDDEKIEPEYVVENNEDLDVIIKNKQLKDLIFISGANIPISGSKLDVVLRNNPNLSILLDSHLWISHPTINVMLAISSSLRREGCSLGYLRCSNVEDDSLIDVLCRGLQKNQSVWHLYIDGGRIERQGAIAIAKLLACSEKIQRLSLEDNQLKDESIEFIAPSLKDNETLKSLTIKSQYISDDGVKCIAANMYFNKTIKRLDLSRNEIKDNGAKEISSILKKSKNIANLDLSNNQIGRDGGLAISEALYSNESLAMLDISGNLLDDTCAVKLEKAIIRHPLFYVRCICAMSMSIPTIDSLADVSTKSERRYQKYGCQKFDDDLKTRIFM